MEVSYPRTTSSHGPTILERFSLAEQRALAGAPLFFHLTLIATDPLFLSQGYARALCEPMLRLADELRLPCYLENTTGRNPILIFRLFIFFCLTSLLSLGTAAGKAFYESMGFQECETIVFRESPLVAAICMRRDPIV